MKPYLAVLAFALPCFPAHAEDIPLTELPRLELKNAHAEASTHHNSPALKVTEKAIGAGEAFAVIKGLSFRNGTIDVEVSGAPLKAAGEGARGFIGVAFRMQSDGSHYEEIYIRPTNGRTDDQLRRNHSTQYVSGPDWPWERLRKESPGVYESYADMAPGEWTRLRIVVHGADAKLYVGDASQPCLLVHDLKLGDVAGGVALWIGPGTEGYFRKLKISAETEKEQAYGSNEVAGHYVQTPDAKLYYERYGEGGRPLVLLHGGEYGYIDEFGGLIREMSKSRTVVAIATRGYGRSERGSVPLSHRQFARDAASVIKAVFKDGQKVDVLGFSEGAITSYLLAASQPQLVHRVIAIGGPLGRYGQSLPAIESDPFTPEMMQKEVPEMVAARKKIMPKPELFEPLIREIDHMYAAASYVKQTEVNSISAPTLIMVGDRDRINRPDHMVDIYHLLPQGQLAFIPGCGHVVLGCKPDMVIRMASSFLNQGDK